MKTTFSKQLILLAALLLAGVNSASAQFVRGDVNGDSSIDITDVTLLVDYIHGTPFPKVARTVSFDEASVTKTFGDAAFTNAATPSAGVSDGALSYSSSNTDVATVIASTGEVTIAGVGTTTITASITAGDTYAAASNTYTLTVSKAAASVTTAPAAVTSTLTYSGEAQTLVSTGEATGGTLKYYVSTTNSTPETTADGWTDVASTGTDAATYYVWYYVEADGNHTSTAVTAIDGASKAIAQKDLTITAKAQSISYGASISTGTDQVEANGLVTGDAITAVTLTPSGTDVTTEGTITPSAATTTKGIDNYNVTYTAGNLTITGVSAAVTTAPAAVTEDLTYSGAAQILFSEGSTSDGTLMYKVTTSSTKPESTDDFTTSIDQQTNAGTYYLWYYVAGDASHSDTEINDTGISKVIGKAPATDPSTTMTTAVSAKDDLSYTGENLDLVNAGASKAGTLKYQVTTTNSKPEKTVGTWTETVPTATDAGTYYVWYYAEGNDNYEPTEVSETPIEVTVAAASGDDGTGSGPGGDSGEDL